MTYSKWWNTLLSKALVHIWRKDKEFYRQAKAEGFQDHQTSFMGSAKKTTLNREGIKNTKIIKGKNVTGKGKHTQ